jgi:hypothetical protein
MSTGFENTSEETMRTLINNLKSGALRVIEMGPDALVSHGPKECPPAAAFRLNMTLLSMFEAEFLRRDLDFDGLIGQEFRAIMDMWISEN